VTLKKSLAMVSLKKDKLKIMGEGNRFTGYIISENQHCLLHYQEFGE
jgi:hypothetical protein